MSDYDEGFRAAARELMVRAINKATGLRDDFRCEESYAIADGLLPPAPSETAATMTFFDDEARRIGRAIADADPTIQAAKATLARVATERACPRCGSTDFRCAEHEFCAKCTADDETRPSVHPYATERAGVGPLYPCEDCGTLRTKAEGGTTFTVCDACWDKAMERAAKCATCGGRGVVSPSYIDYRKPCETCGGTGRARGGAK